MDVTALLLLVIGLAVGCLLGALAQRARWAADVASARAEARAARERQIESERAGDRAQQQLAERFRALSSEALERTSEQLLQLADTRLGAAHAHASGELEQRQQAVEHLVKPLENTLARVERQLRELESARVTAYTALTEQVGFVRTTSEQLRHETASLVSALRAPQARGRWGEMQLRRVVEIAGMVSHCDFDEQPTFETAGGRVRPDLVVRLAGDKSVVVDAKVSLSAYLEAAETADSDVRTDRLAAHARHLRTHVDALAAKSYWAALPSTPEFVVLFVPGEAFLAPALEHDATLLEHAMSRRVIIATPTTLMTMLRTVAYSWQQAALADSAREVFELGRELYGRLGTLGNNVQKLGRSLSRAVTEYNATVGSLESRVLVTARRLNDLDIVDSLLEAPPPLDDAPRALSSPELLASAATDAAVLALYPDEPDDAVRHERADAEEAEAAAVRWTAGLAEPAANERRAVHRTDGDEAATS